MEPRNRFFLILVAVMVVLGIALYTFVQRDRSSSQVFPATIQRDCAPWDGSAFTVQIPWQNGSVIDISIWQSPEINFPKSFSFPDTTGQVGNTALLNSTGLPEPLNGTVSFTHVDTSTAVDGTFDLRDAAANAYKGIFHAEWQELMVLCG